MNQPPYKEHQILYSQLVTDHQDDFDHMEWVEEEELVENALLYFKERCWPLVYPAKSYSVAVIYAILIEEHYNIPVRETLNDPDLFLGNDDFFTIYSEDPETYESILLGLKELPDWRNAGWVPKTTEYFRLECTAEGIEETIAKLPELYK